MDFRQAKSHAHFTSCTEIIRRACVNLQFQFNPHFQCSFVVSELLLSEMALSCEALTNLTCVQEYEGTFTTDGILTHRQHLMLHSDNNTSHFKALTSIPLPQKSLKKNSHGCQDASHTSHGLDIQSSPHQRSRHTCNSRFKKNFFLEAVFHNTSPIHV